MNSRIDPKKQAKLLELFLAEKGFEISHSTCLHVIAILHGIKNWNTMKATLTDATKPAKDTKLDEIDLNDRVEDLEHSFTDDLQSLELRVEHLNKELEKALERISELEPYYDPTNDD